MQGEKAENFLLEADVASVIFDMDPGLLKQALFGAMAKFEKFASIQVRCFQLLQDCHLLAPPGIMNEEIVPRYDAILRTLSSWIGKPEVIINLFQLLSMVADRDVVKLRSVKVEEHELIYFINKAIALHNNSKPVQRAALQLFEAIIENSDKKSFAAISTRIFKPVLDNLLLNGDDTSICFSSFSILNSLAGHAASLIAPWTDQIINLSLTTISKQLSGEVTSQCLQLLGQITQDKDSLLTVAGHERGLRVFVDALVALRPKNLFAMRINLQILLSIIEDYDIATIAFQSIGDEDPLDYALKLQGELKAGFDKFTRLCAEEDHLDEHQMEDVFILHSQIDMTLEEMIKDVPEDVEENEMDEGGQDNDAHASDAADTGGDMVESPLAQAGADSHSVEQRVPFASSVKEEIPAAALLAVVEQDEEEEDEQFDDKDKDSVIPVDEKFAVRVEEVQFAGASALASSLTGVGVVLPDEYEDESLLAVKADSYDDQGEFNRKSEASSGLEQTTMESRKDAAQPVTNPPSVSAHEEGDDLRFSPMSQQSDQPFTHFEPKQSSKSPTTAIEVTTEPRTNGGAKEMPSASSRQSHIQHSSAQSSSSVLEDVPPSTAEVPATDNAFASGSPPYPKAPAALLPEMVDHKQVSAHKEILTPVQERHAYVSSADQNVPLLSSSSKPNPAPAAVTISAPVIEHFKPQTKTPIFSHAESGSVHSKTEAPAALTPKMVDRNQVTVQKEISTLVQERHAYVSPSGHNSPPQPAPSKPNPAPAAVTMSSPVIEHFIEQNERTHVTNTVQDKNVIESKSVVEPALEHIVVPSVSIGSYHQRRLAPSPQTLPSPTHVPQSSPSARPTSRDSSRNRATTPNGSSPEGRGLAATEVGERQRASPDKREKNMRREAELAKARRDKETIAAQKKAIAEQNSVMEELMGLLQAKDDELLRLKAERKSLEDSAKASEGRVTAAAMKVEQMKEALQIANEQSARAIEKANVTHNMFRDAVRKIEVLVMENEKVWNKFYELQAAEETMMSPIEADQPGDLETETDMLSVQQSFNLESKVEPPNSTPTASAATPATIQVNTDRSVGSYDNDEVESKGPASTSLTPLAAAGLKRSSSFKLSPAPLSNRKPSLRSTNTSEFMLSPEGRSMQQASRNAVEDSKLSVSIAGILEALEHVDSAQSSVDATHTLYFDVQSTAEKVVMLFNRLSLTARRPVSSQAAGNPLLGSTLPIRSLRTCLENMGLMHNPAEPAFSTSPDSRQRTELLLSQFRAKHITLFGAAFTLVLCATEKSSSLNGSMSASRKSDYGNMSQESLASAMPTDSLSLRRDVLNKVQLAIDRYLLHLENMVNADDALNPLDAEPLLMPGEFEDIVRLMEREKKPLVALFT
eukprot:gene32210-38958_t